MGSRYILCVVFFVRLKRSVVEAQKAAHLFVFVRLSRNSSVYNTLEREREGGRTVNLSLESTREKKKKSIHSREREMTVDLSLEPTRSTVELSKNTQDVLLERDRKENNDEVYETFDTWYVIVKKWCFLCTYHSVYPVEREI